MGYRPTDAKPRSSLDCARRLTGENPIYNCLLAQYTLGVVVWVAQGTLVAMSLNLPFFGRAVSLTVFF